MKIIYHLTGGRVLSGQMPMPEGGTLSINEVRDHMARVLLRPGPDEQHPTPITAFWIHDEHGTWHMIMTAHLIHITVELDDLDRMRQQRAELLKQGS